MSKLFKRVSAIMLMFSVVFSAFMANMKPALAAETEAELSQELVEILCERFEELGIDESSWEGLLTKIEKGETLDCYKEEYRDMDTELTYTADDGICYSKYVYPDGSVRLVKVTPGTISEENKGRSVSGGSWQSGSGYRVVTGAVVEDETVFVAMGFKADFQCIQSYGGKIDSVYSPIVQVFGGTYSNLNLSIVVESGNPAKAVCSADVSAVGGIAAQTYTLVLKVYSNSYSGSYETY